ncbi:MAG: hypothetical protein U0802_19070 [Candidatus Binatia bacterium]
MIQGRTWHGYLGYLDFGFVQNNGGAVQLLADAGRLPPLRHEHLHPAAHLGARQRDSNPAHVLARTAHRRHHRWHRRGAADRQRPGAAVLGAQRKPAFRPIALCALVTAYVCLWPAQRLSGSAVVVTALWMPVSLVLFRIGCLPDPAIGRVGPRHAHWAALVAQGMVRRAGACAAGMVLWLFSLTAMKAALHDWEAVRRSVEVLYGASVAQQGEFCDASTVELIRSQAVSLDDKLRNRPGEHGLSHGQFLPTVPTRGQPAQHDDPQRRRHVDPLRRPRCRIGQWVDRRAFLLFAWWGIAILPAILSQDPADRRMGQVVARPPTLVRGVAVAAFLALVAAYGGRSGSTAAARRGVLLVCR